jgi:tetratricopeptide (TPR) repeat protein
MACRPEELAAYTNAANTLKGLGRFQEALENFDRALTIAPNHAATLWSKSLLKLTLGEFDEGWPLYESRLRLDHLHSYHRSFAVPRWSGTEPLAGKTILIHAEQGLGDTLQFARYVPLLEAQGAHVVFEVPRELATLLRSLPMRGPLLMRGGTLPHLDYYCPLLSLPLAFRTRRQTIPGGVPYIEADATAVAGWRARLLELPGLKIGLNWQGHIGAEKQPWVRGRSFALECAAPLTRLPGVSLISLQKGDAARQRSRVEFGRALAELTDPLDTSAAAMMETAALMSALDLVITSDTSVAHLAGALGVPVWVVLQKVPDWRWLLDTPECAWYPTMRLFRQRVAGDWSEVFERVALEVSAWMGARLVAASGDKLSAG